MAFRAAIVGGSGYTGAELLRLLAGHPEIEVVHVTADSNAGYRVADLYPSLVAAYPDLVFHPFEPADLDGVDVAFLALPARPVAAPRRRAGRPRRPPRRHRRRLPPPGRRLRAVVRRGPRGAGADRPVRLRAAGAVPLRHRRPRPRRQPGLLPDGGVAGAGAAVGRRPGRAHRPRRRRRLRRLRPRPGSVGPQPLQRSQRERLRLRAPHPPAHGRDGAGPRPPQPQQAPPRCCSPPTSSR